MKEKIHYLIKELNSSKNLPNKWLKVKGTGDNNNKKSK